MTDIARRVSASLGRQRACAQRSPASRCWPRSSGRTMGPARAERLFAELHHHSCDEQRVDGPTNA
eukprot:scaffold256107_cov31-Tisochrysis_lutea.AAC.3